jgi:hypothetical protein
LEFIHSQFNVDPQAGTVQWKDGRKLTACKFHGLVLTPKEVVWAYSQKELPIGIVRTDPDIGPHVNNLEKYQEEETTYPLGWRLAWRYHQRMPPVLVELSEYGLLRSIIRVSPSNWRTKDERLKKTRAALRRTNIKENSHWEVRTEELVLVRGKGRCDECALGRNVKLIRHGQTYSHRKATRIRTAADIIIRPARKRNSKNPYVKAKVSEFEEPAMECQPLPPSTKQPIREYAREVIQSLKREEYDRRMARWITGNSLDNS